jgi:hypothetical protein
MQHGLIFTHTVRPAATPACAADATLIGLKPF